MIRYRDIKITFAFAVAGLVILLAAYEAGLRWNDSASMPIGLWRMTPLSAPPTDGDIVVFCMPESMITKMALERGYVPSGNCPSGTKPLFKPVAAIAGEIVTVAPTGIAIRGIEQPNTAPLIQDPNGRALPILPFGNYRLTEDDLWLMSSNTPLSFDSRYYGPVRIADIKGLASPVLTWWADHDSVIQDEQHLAHDSGRTQ